MDDYLGIDGSNYVDISMFISFTFRTLLTDTATDVCVYKCQFSVKTNLVSLKRKDNHFSFISFWNSQKVHNEIFGQIHPIAIQ